MEPTTFDVTGTLRLRVRMRSGDVRIIETGAPTASVQVTGERDADEVSVEHDTSTAGDSVLQVIQRKDGWGLRGRDLRVEVTVPPGTVADVATGSGDVSTEGTLAELVLQSGSGDATIDRVAGAARLKNSSGDLRVREVEEHLTATTASGDIEAGSIGGALEARTASGDIEVGTATGPAKAMSASGDLTIRSSHADLSRRSVSGDIAIGVPPGTRVWFDVSSTSGDVMSDLDPDDARGGDEAAYEIRAASVSGDIRIRRAHAPDTTVV
jgi:DUF4097 and DUF4098 domain-containing protein YvlB